MDDRECYFGPRKCDNTKHVCLGWDIGHDCLISSDCNAGLYCFRGKCAKELDEWAPCDMDEDCGHDKFCYYEEPLNQVKGICLKWNGIT